MISSIYDNTSTEMVKPAYLDSFKRPTPRTYLAFVAEVDRLTTGRMLHEPLGRLFARTTCPDDFNLVWYRELGDDFDYQYTLAERFFKVNDNHEEVTELLRIWCRRNDIDIIEEEIDRVVSAAADATCDQRQRFGFMIVKIKTQKLQKQKNRRAEMKVGKKKTKTVIKEALPGTPAEVAEKLQLDRKAVGVALQRLWNDGYVDRHTGGYYTKAGVADDRPTPRVVKEDKKTPSVKIEVLYKRASQKFNLGKDQVDRMLADPDSTLREVL